MDHLGTPAAHLRAERVEPAAVALRRPRAEVRAERAGEASRGGVLLASSERVWRLLVEPDGHGRRAPLVGHRADDELAANVADRHLETVARPDLLRRLDADAVDVRLASVHRVGGSAPCLEETGCPEPPVDPHAVHRRQ